MNNTAETAAAGLREALAQRGLALPGVRPLHDALALGPVDVTTAARLGDLLGAPPLAPGVNLTDWRQAHVVAGRLTEAVRAVAAGAFLDSFFHPDCVRCDREATVALGALDIPTAVRLAAVLGAGPDVFPQRAGEVTQ
ncbi:hypothetical protein AB0J21_11915 [Streptomyces sp. NPDC049954]|uniref:hypothetical protein n=1 Tax=Streptomyces sp. NPDC049954 TaxID=3155779 RepID=UPI003419401B